VTAEILFGPPNMSVFVVQMVAAEGDEAKQRQSKVFYLKMTSYHVLSVDQLLAQAGYCIGRLWYMSVCRVRPFVCLVKRSSEWVSELLITKFYLMIRGWLSSQHCAKRAVAAIVAAMVAATVAVTIALCTRRVKVRPPSGSNVSDVAVDCRDRS